MEPFLPSEPTSSSDRDIKKAAPSRRRKSIHKKKTGSIRAFIHFVVYHVVSLLFSVFFRFRRAYRLVRGKVVELLKYHHRTPEFIAHDVKSLQKLPKHLSVIVDYQEDDEHQGNAGLEGLVNDVCEIAAWTAAAGIPFLSVYERTGMQHPQPADTIRVYTNDNPGALKNYLPQTHASIWNTLEAYFGARRKPTLSLRAPHLPSYSPPNTPPQTATSDDDLNEERQHLTVLLLSEHDGRDTIVDLTRTLAEMAQKGDVRQEQINMDLIDAQLSDHVSSEPDLLVLFSPTVQLKGYPPWQLRLTEIL